MGLEKVVLNVIEDADGEVYDNAYFSNGTLWLASSADVPGIRLYRVINAIKSVVTCNLEVNQAGTDIVIDFVPCK
jgi:hypothetical protein